ncbi:MAG TPA: pirin family protein [Pyrinomonadaceae bacterium]|nr:pirin family protein [Pyrinomonadaceae bacterium]
MIKVRPSEERGKTRTSWLDSNHTFSFNRYYDPRYTGFRDLLVINEDFVAPGQGFGTHSHRDMEILSYVVSGALEHRDSSGGNGVIRPDELQRMSAGTGVSHSEFNSSASEPVHFLQIWIVPDREGLEPEYEQRAFPRDGRQGRLRLIASPEGGGSSVTIHQNVKVYDALLNTGDDVSHQLERGRHAWVQVVKGHLTVNGTSLRPGDGAAISEEHSLNILASDDAEMLLFDLA